MLLASIFFGFPFETLKNEHCFVQVRALPNVPLPEFILSSLPPRVRSSITLATNPCRLRLGKQEIVVFREVHRLLCVFMVFI